MNTHNNPAGHWRCLCHLLLLAACTFQATGQTRRLPGHVPEPVAHLKPIERLAATNRLWLSIGLPLRDPAGLKQFLHELSDPTSLHFRRYVTPEEFAARWGPTEEDYAAVTRFAQTNGLRVARNHKNRMLLDVTGPVGTIEKTFHFKLQKYRHPAENRDFFAPESEPAVDAGVPILDIEGLNNYIRPHRVGGGATPVGGSPGATPLSGGSGTNGWFMAADLRAAYAPGVTLDGTGQTVALVELDGYYPSDIIAYEQSNNLAHVTLTNVLIDGASGLPGSSGITPVSVGTLEDAMDIEMVIAMAPGISRVIIYQGVVGSGNPSVDLNTVPHGNDLLNQIATDNLAKQISTSWFWCGGSAGLGGPDKTTDQIFQQMAAQGQSFFSASGDGGAYWGDRDPYLASNHNDAPLLTSPYITLVGGTILATDGAGGSWTNEVAWKVQIPGTFTNSTTGATSTTYGIPAWQQGVDMSTNGGSPVMRNTPDVAMAADGIFMFADGGPQNGGATSAASPLWAGFMALVNQQAELHGHPPAGFINPTVYAIGQSSNYANCFHDITLGNNTSSLCPTNFFAVPGYDLCTGWGTPKGQALINALADPDVLVITPGLGFTAANGPAGPFNLTNETFVLTNGGAASIAWSLGGVPAWLTASIASGALPAGGMANVDLSLNANAASSANGIYAATVWFTNVTSGYVQSRQFTLEVRQPLVENGGFETGDFSAWKVLGWWLEYNGFVSVANNLVAPGPHSGNYFADLFPHYVLAWYNPDPYLPTFFSQTISTMPGQVYQISFWLNGFVDPQLGPSTEWAVSWGGNTVFDLTPTNSFYPAWTNCVVLATATTSETQLQFGLNGHFFLDDVTVSLVSNVAPVMLTQPVSQSPLSGSSYSMRVLAAGTWPLAFHWRFNGMQMSDDARKSGTSTAQLGITNASPQDIGSYDVVISNTYGAVTSAVAVVSLVGSNILVNGSFESPVLAANSIATTLPAGWSGSAYVVNGNPFPGYGAGVSDSLDWYVGPLELPLQGPTAKAGQQYLGLDADYGLVTVTQTFQIAAAGDYQVSWYDNDLIWDAAYATSTYSLGIFDGAGATIASTNFDAFNLNTVQGMTWRQRALQVSLGVGSYALVFQKQASTPDVFNPSTLIDDVAVRPLTTPPAPPKITLPPHWQAVNVGQSAGFYALASGSPPLNYQWQFNGTNLTNSGRITGTTNNALQIAAALTGDTGGYAVVVTNAYGTITSAVATLTVFSSPPIRATGIIATATSELAAYGRLAAHAVDGVYYDPYFWESVGVNQGFGEDRSPAITFDLRQVWVLDLYAIWNGHEPPASIKRMVVETSLDGTDFTSLGEVTLTTISPESETNLLGGVLARYVRFDIRENGAGQVFPVVGTPTLSCFVAIDEVEFYGQLAGVAAPTIALQFPVFTPGNLSFAITSSAGLTVNVARAHALPGPWTNIGSILIGTNGVGLFQDTNPPAGSGFYRAVLP